VAKTGEEAPVLCFVGDSALRLWGMTPVERLKRAFARHRITRIVGVDDLPDISGPVIVLRADIVLDAPLVTALDESSELLLLGKDNGADVPVAAHVADGKTASAVARLLSGSPCTKSVPGLEPKRPEELDTAFWKALRKRETPYALVIDDTSRREVEWRVFMGTYKGATDFVTKYLWPRPAFVITKLLAPIGITPNMVTAVSAVCVVVAYFKFLSGDWMVGLLAAWMMTFLDTVDGKLARVTLTSSKWGDIFDHGIDLVHPPFWYSAWAVAVMASPHPLDPEVFWLCLSAILGGYVLQRIIEGMAIKFFGLEIHIWRQVDTLFRQITARRNPNLVIMTVSVIGGRPDWGLLAVAAWTLLCLALHVVQLAQAYVARRRHGPLQSWMNPRPRKS
jgi:phosphatidylglycerophosphate synthase